MWRKTHQTLTENVEEKHTNIKQQVGNTHSNREVGNTHCNREVGNTHSKQNGG